uniref:nucleoside diphosphate phosphatase n=1 Tax=Mastacembelus armatus TaxID=205130 RepID=A0A7N8X8W5_9TELE
MKRPKVAGVFIFVCCLLTYLMLVKRHYAVSKPEVSRPPHPRPGSEHSRECGLRGDTSAVALSCQHGIMFDAGSTGTRVHIFKFQMESREAPKLVHETFRAIKPGLSAYADDPEKCTAGIMELLQVAKSSIPPSMWNITPVVLKATAGLRLLPGEKAKHLLDQVRAVFLESPFLSREDSVSIMDGTDEGISAWITVNFLTGESPAHNVDACLCFHFSASSVCSYLGLGLMSARLAVLGGVDASPLGGSTELVSPCLAPEYLGRWDHADVVYTVKGQKAGEPVYEACVTKVEKVLYRKVTKVSEAADIDFYAFSYYYDRAVDLGVIGEQAGGTIKVADYIDAAKRVCSELSVSPLQSPFLCLDLVYISVLLQELGFPPHKQFKLARTINQVETSWALGATFHYIESLKRY